MNKIHKNEILRLFPILKAINEGKTIQFNDSGVWRDIDGNSEGFFLDTFIEETGRYRIKPEPKYRLFTNSEDCWQEMQNHQPFGWIKRNGYRYNIISISNTSVKIIDTRDAISTLYFSDLFMRKDYRFIDGTLFGVRVEE